MQTSSHFLIIWAEISPTLVEASFARMHSQWKWNESFHSLKWHLTLIVDKVFSSFFPISNFQCPRLPWGADRTCAVKTRKTKFTRKTVELFACGVMFGILLGWRTWKAAFHPPRKPRRSPRSPVGPLSCVTLAPPCGYLENPRTSDWLSGCQDCLQEPWRPGLLESCRKWKVSFLRLNVETKPSNFYSLAGFPTMCDFFLCVSWFDFVVCNQKRMPFAH